MVIAIYTATLMLAAGLKETLTATGSKDNGIIVRSGAQNEIQSAISREQGAIILNSPYIQRDSAGQALGVADLVLLMSLPKKTGGRSNVPVRGTDLSQSTLRPQVTLLQGRYPAKSAREVMIGEAVSSRFAGASLQSSLRFSGVPFKIVGIFAAKNTAFESEVWGDAQTLMSIFRRDNYSSVTVKLKPSETSFTKMKNWLESDKRFVITMRNEQDFYRSQSESLTMFISFLGTFVTIIFSIASVLGCMITLYASLAQRMREIGICRAIGFSRWQIVQTFVIESLIITIIGGVIGILLASLLMRFSFATTNFDTFSDLTFTFTLTPKIVLHSLLFSIIMGLIGVVLPAAHAARIKGSLPAH
jgi:ABC-type antimicrobial peptide transport system permease subunit